MHTSLIALILSRGSNKLHYWLQIEYWLNSSVYLLIRIASHPFFLHNCFIFQLQKDFLEKCWDAKPEERPSAADTLKSLDVVFPIWRNEKIKNINNAMHTTFLIWAVLLFLSSIIQLFYFTFHFIIFNIEHLPSSPSSSRPISINQFWSQKSHISQFS